MTERPEIVIEGWEAALGTVVEVTFPDGSPAVSVRLPAGVRDNALIRVPGPRPAPDGGDRYARVRIRNPVRLESPDRPSWWGRLLGRLPGRLIPRRAPRVTAPPPPPLTPTSIGRSRTRPATGGRLRTGDLITRPPAGPGTLTVHNEGDRDAVVFLTRIGGRRATAAVYVEGAGSCRVDGIPDGSYELYFASGWNWDARAAAFTRDPQRFLMDKVAVFRGGNGYTVTVTPVAGGNSAAREIPGDRFPSA